MRIVSNSFLSWLQIFSLSFSRADHRSHSCWSTRMSSTGVQLVFGRISRSIFGMCPLSSTPATAYYWVNMTSFVTTVYTTKSSIGMDSPCGSWNAAEHLLQVMIPIISTTYFLARSSSSSCVRTTSFSLICHPRQLQLQLQLSHFTSSSSHCHLA